MLPLYWFYVKPYRSGKIYKILPIISIISSFFLILLFLEFFLWNLCGKYNEKLKMPPQVLHKRSINKIFKYFVKQPNGFFSIYMFWTIFHIGFAFLITASASFLNTFQNVQNFLLLKLWHKEYNGNFFTTVYIPKQQNFITLTKIICKFF